MIRCFLGIDTSCYTTSVAVLTEAGELLTDSRKLLQVKPGSRGLAQSEMVFQHSRNLPQLFEDVFLHLQAEAGIAGIGVSAYPRPLPTSYMPAFLVGEGYAKVLAAMQKCKLKRISHQENHIGAGIWSAGGPFIEEFLAVHVSGGTTEVVHVIHKESMAVTLLGTSCDLHAGQFVDRVGVALGLPFPAGPHLEKLAAAGRQKKLVLPVAVQGLHVSFSGPETHVMRLIKQNADAAAVAAGVEVCIADSIYKMISAAVKQTQIFHVLLVGGVTSNTFIRQYITEKLTAEQVKLYCPQKQFSGDNAVGAAFFALTS
ncbi:hypothetical protein P22_0361 [Propionispora sp. 2/2-37]|uniref:Kae1-like domain-containing protein n=1 Tax=Propionispora sp. 2/2-37 TaxID=1677858 RepID=UPI0006BB6831|nr:O-sialoglycoprotein endopeptidase [Propionispora sp. 2/2-37]CUH94295.1 hypothetical protein P22_0361 [Propionispora sp. 2/2-37]